MPGTDHTTRPERSSRPGGRLFVHPAGRAASLTTGLVLAVGAPLWWVTTDHTPVVEAVNPGAISRLTESEAEPQGRGPDGAVDPASATTVPVSRVGGDLVQPVTALLPVGVRIPAIGVDADVRAVGVARDGQVAIPSNIDDAGWFRWGSAPGSASGSVVLVGHLDSATQPGLGAFAYLRTLDAGAIVVITTENGRVWRYRVVARESVDKERLPLDDVFSRAGRPRLVLMTCGGSFDAASASYDSTVVVTAVPVRP